MTTRTLFLTKCNELLQELELACSRTVGDGKKVPNLCVFCGNARSFPDFVQISFEDFENFLKFVEFSENDVSNNEIMIMYQASKFFKCSHTCKGRKVCRKNGFQFEQLKRIVNGRWPLVLHENDPHDEGMDFLRDEFQFNFDMDTSMSSCESQTEEEFDINFESTDLQSGRCIMDSSFFKNFRCKFCKKWLLVQNIKRFSVSRLWGFVDVFCWVCKKECNIRTVSSISELVL